MKNWLKHLWAWILTFPIGDYHLYTGLAGSGEYYCLLCGKKEEIEEDEF